MGRSIGGALQSEGPQRSNVIVRQVVAKHAPWWGFSLYALVWAFLGGTVFAACTAAVISPDESELSWSTWRRPMLVSLAIITPLFVRWVIRRRGAITRLARDGQLVQGRVTNVQPSLLALLSGSTSARSGSRAIVVGIPVHEPAQHYRGLAPTSLAEQMPIGSTATILVAPDIAYGIVISPTGEDFVAKR